MFKLQLPDYGTGYYLVDAGTLQLLHEPVETDRKGNLIVRDLLKHTRRGTCFELDHTYGTIIVTHSVITQRCLIYVTNNNSRLTVLDLETHTHFTLEPKHLLASLLILNPAEVVLERPDARLGRLFQGRDTILRVAADFIPLGE